MGVILDCVDRIGGIAPVTDFRTWPSPDDMSSVLSAPAKGLGYNLTLDQLTAAGRVQSHRKLGTVGESQGEDSAHPWGQR